MRARVCVDAFRGPCAGCLLVDGDDRPHGEPLAETATHSGAVRLGCPERRPPGPGPAAEGAGRACEWLRWLRKEAGAGAGLLKKAELAVRDPKAARLVYATSGQVRVEGDGGWLACDDEFVESVDEGRVGEMQAYLLMYLLRDTAGMPLLEHPSDFSRPPGDARFVEDFARRYRALGHDTLSDPWCAERHREALGRFVRDHVDILFANEDEAASLCDSDIASATETLCGQVDEAVITRGENGAFVGSGDIRHECAAQPFGRVEDTTGAGDLFAAGYLFGRTNGRDPLASSLIASLAAGEVISHIGARPQADVAAMIAAEKL